MAVEQWSDKVLVVRLADDPQFTDDLAAAEELLETGRFDAVLDFADVTFMNSTNIARLLRVRKLVIERDARQVLCGIPTGIWGTFLVTGLDKVFEFSDGVPAALATLQMA